MGFLTKEYILLLQLTCHKMKGVVGTKNPRRRSKVYALYSKMLQLVYLQLRQKLLWYDKGHAEGKVRGMAPYV